MVRKIKSSKNVVFTALALILLGNVAVNATGENENLGYKRVPGEISVCENAKRIKLPSDKIKNEIQKKHIAYEITEIPNCTKQAIKITASDGYNESEVFNEEDIRTFLLSQKPIFHRKYKVFVLDKEDAITYADALIIDSKIKIKENFLAENNGWCELSDTPGLVLKKDYKIYTKNKLKYKFYETTFYEKEIEKSPSPPEVPNSPDIIYTFGGEPMQRPENFDEFLKKGDISEYYNYEIITVPNWSEKVLKITPKYSDSLNYSVDWDSVKKYLMDNQFIFEQTHKMSQKDYPNPLKKVDAILVHGRAEPLHKENGFLYSYFVQPKGHFMRMFIKPGKKESLPYDLLKSFEEEENKKTLAPSTSESAYVTTMIKETINEICLSILKFSHNGRYLLSITPESFDSYGCDISTEELKKFVVRNKDVFGSKTVPENFVLMDYFDMIIFDKKLIEHRKLEVNYKNYFLIRKPYNLYIVIRQDSVGSIPPNSFFEELELAYDKDMDYIISNGQTEEWDDNSYAVSSDTPVYKDDPEEDDDEEDYYYPEGEGEDTDNLLKKLLAKVPKHIKRYFAISVIPNRNEKILDETILSAVIFPSNEIYMPTRNRIKQENDEKICETEDHDIIMDITSLRDYIYAGAMAVMPFGREYCSIDDFDYLDILVIDNRIRTNYSLPLEQSCWVKFHKGLNCTIYVKRELLVKITRKDWQYILTYIRGPSTL